MMPKIHSFTACTLMPDRRVASMLLPTAYTRRPNTVWLVT
jgi:hypothetical protein